MIDKKQLYNVEYFNYFGSMVTNAARSAGEIQSRVATQKQHSIRRYTEPSVSIKGWKFLA
jgi:hypothetical protein